ncbi:hypothetical protein ACFQ60_44315 [Streptomyces zhihengii]
MRGRNRFTLGDLLSQRLGGRPVRVAMGVAVLVTVLPLLVVQLAAAGEIMTVMLDLPEDALTGCTIATGALMVCFAASGGMRGTGYVQILKTVVLVAAVLLLAGLVLDRFGWNPFSLWDAAAEGSGQGPRTAPRAPVRGLGGRHPGPDRLPSDPRPRRGLHAARDDAPAPDAPRTPCPGDHGLGRGRRGRGLRGHRGRRPGRRGPGRRGGAAGGRPGRRDGPADRHGRPGPGVAPAHSVLFAFVAIAVFATTLAAVAGIAVAAAASLAHDLAPPRGAGTGRPACPRPDAPGARSWPSAPSRSCCPCWHSTAIRRSCSPSRSPSPRRPSRRW